jgi:hypothetical protein
LPDLARIEVRAGTLVPADEDSLASVGTVRAE